jgi:hypothetical protein
LASIPCTKRERETDRQTDRDRDRDRGREERGRKAREGGKETQGEREEVLNTTSHQVKMQIKAQ